MIQAKNLEAAQALIDQGADVIMQHTDSTAPVQVAEKAGVWSFGQASDMQSLHQNPILTSIIDDWAPYYVERSIAARDGTWKQQNTWHGLKEEWLLWLHIIQQWEVIC